MQKAGTEEAHLVEDIFAHVLLFKIDLEVPGWSQVPFQNLPGFFLITVPSALACEAVSVRCSRLIWMQLGLKFDAYYKPSTVSTQPSGLRSCSINNSPAFLWLFSLFSPPPPAHLFLFLPLSQALKKTHFLYFCWLCFSLQGICPPPRSSLGRSPSSRCGQETSDSTRVCEREIQPA